MRKLTTMLVAFAMPMALVAQEKDFTITATVAKFPENATAYLRYQGANGMVTDSAAAENGTFTFKGKIDEPRPASIALVSKTEKNVVQNSIDFFVEPGTIAFTSKSQLKSANVSGSPNTKQFLQLKKKLEGDTDNPMVISRFLGHNTSIIMPDGRTMGIKTETPAEAAVRRGEGTTVMQTVTSSGTVSVPAGSGPPSMSSGGSGRGGSGGRGGSRGGGGGGSGPSGGGPSAVSIQEDVVSFIRANPSSFASLYALNSLQQSKRLSFSEFVELYGSIDASLKESNAAKVMFSK